MSRGHYNAEAMRENARLIRAMKLAEPTIRTREIRNRLGLKLSTDSINVILRNERYYDETYTQPKVLTCKYDNRPFRPKRTASIDCKHVCPICGMGFDTDADSMKCCDRVVRMVMNR